METGRFNFQGIEMVLAHKLIGILSNIIHRKHNIEIRFLFPDNPVVLFAILSHRAFHFCKIGLVPDPNIPKEYFEQVLDYWILQGAEVEICEKFENPIKDNAGAYVIRGNNADVVKEITQTIPAQTKFIIYHMASSGQSPSDIWLFMHPFWAVGDIKDYFDISVGGQLYFILTCEKRG